MAKKEVIAIELIDEAIWPNGRWVAIGTQLGGAQAMLARDKGALVVFRYLEDLDEAFARFFEYANIDPFSGRIPDGINLVVHKPDLFRLPSREAWKKIGGEGSR